MRPMDRWIELSTAMINGGQPALRAATTQRTPHKHKLYSTVDRSMTCTPANVRTVRVNTLCCYDDRWTQKLARLCCCCCCRPHRMHAPLAIASRRASLGILHGQRCTGAQIDGRPDLSRPLARGGGGGRCTYALQPASCPPWPLSFACSGTYSQIGIHLPADLWSSIV
jgi:hypothetical protein